MLQVSASGHRSLRPLGVKIEISILVMRLNLMIKIWTPFVCQDGDKNCDHVKVASNSYSMKPALVLLIGIHPNGVGQHLCQQFLGGVKLVYAAVEDLM